MSKRIFLTGTIRNGGQKLTRRIEQVIHKFQEICHVEFFVIESDSNDKTVEYLFDLTARFSCFNFKTLGRLETIIDDRIARIAYCRNLCLSEFRSRSKETYFDYFGVLDLDGVNDSLSIEPLRKAIELLEHDCDAIFPNQKKYYYDIGALRAPGWVEDNPHAEYSTLVAAGFSPEKAFRTSISDKMIHIDTNASPIRVDSAFGGLGIYKAELARRSTYLPTQQQELSCVEHVLFNEGLGSDVRLLIVPWLTNAGYTEHTIHKNLVWKYIFLALRPVRAIVKTALGESRSQVFLRRLKQFFLGM